MNFMNLDEALSQYHSGSKVMYKAADGEWKEFTPDTSVSMNTQFSIPSERPINQSTFDWFKCAIISELEKRLGITDTEFKRCFSVEDRNETAFAIRYALCDYAAGINWSGEELIHANYVNERGYSDHISRINCYAGYDDYFSCGSYLRDMFIYTQMSTTKSDTVDLSTLCYPVNHTEYENCVNELEPAKVADKIFILFKICYDHFVRTLDNCDVYLPLVMRSIGRINARHDREYRHLLMHKQCKCQWIHKKQDGSFDSRVDQSDFVEEYILEPDVDYIWKRVSGVTHYSGFRTMHVVFRMCGFKQLDIIGFTFYFRLCINALYGGTINFCLKDKNDEP